VARDSKKRGKVADSPSSYNDDLKKFFELASEIKEKYKLSNYDLIDVLLEKRAEKPLDMIPVSIFDNKDLSALEAIVKYMKENLNFGSGEIGKLLKRDISTISSTYIKARKKHPSEFSVGKPKYFIPLSALSNRHYSILESIVKFLKKTLNLSNNEIAKLLNRDNRTIWTVYSRAVKKGDVA
jgi:hypothetical protein